MRLIIVILIVIAGLALIREDNRFPHINSQLAELICIQEGIYDASDY